MGIETKPVYTRKDSEKYKGAVNLEKRRIVLEGSKVMTDANLLIYFNDFNLGPEDIEGRKILDLGSGEKEIFSKEAAAYGTEVFSLNPRLRAWWPRMRIKKFGLDSNWQKKSVAGRAQELPFKNESMDMIFARWSYPSFTKEDHEKLLALRELMRVLKENGKLFIYPINVYLDDNLKHRYYDLDFNNKEKFMDGLRISLGAEAVDWLEEMEYEVKPVTPIEDTWKKSIYIIKKLSHIPV